MVSHAARDPEERQSARSDGAHGAACPGWKLALARAAAELEKMKTQCSTLQLQNERLKNELVDRLPEAREHKKCLEQVSTWCSACVADTMLCFLPSPSLLHGLELGPRPHVDQPCRLLHPCT